MDSSLNMDVDLKIGRKERVQQDEVDLMCGVKRGDREIGPLGQQARLCGLSRKKGKAALNRS